MPTAISLFSGAGGLDLGICQAGYELLACIDIDPYCCQTLRFAATKDSRRTLVLEEDIRRINPQQLMRDIVIDPGELDLLCSGSPCQSFSQIGKRNSLNDERGLLLFEIVRFARAFQPKAILIEQVTGLLNARDDKGVIGGVFERLLQALHQAGYTTKWKIILAADYGIAQLRRRLFLVCIRDEPSFEFPSPTHAWQDSNLFLFPLPNYRTVGDVLKGLDLPLSKTQYQGEDSHVDITPNGDKQRIKGVPEGEPLVKQHHLPAEQRQKLSKKDTTKFRRLSRNEPSLTLRCGEIFFHPIEDRYVTVRECMRIHSFPDEYILKGPIRGRSGKVRYLDQYRQVANSVPPLLAKVLAESIRKAVEGH